MLAGISEAARCGYAVLTNGGSALDAVEAAVVCMENNPSFNAGMQETVLFVVQLSVDNVISK